MSFKLIKVVVDVFLEITFFIGYGKECSECAPISGCGVLRKCESFTLDALGCAQVFSELVAEINCKLIKYTFAFGEVIEMFIDNLPFLILVFEDGVEVVKHAHAAFGLI